MFLSAADFIETLMAVIETCYSTWVWSLLSNNNNIRIIILYTHESGIELWRGGRGGWGGGSQCQKYIVYTVYIVSP